MPFAKRSTYTLTLAISSALFSMYTHAEKAPEELGWNCTSSANGQWDCSALPELAQPDITPVTSTVNSHPAVKPAPIKAEAAPVAPASAATPVQIQTTPQSTPAKAASPAKPTQQYAESELDRNNEYAHLDWVFYNNPRGEVCSGRYLEPTFPLHGDEEDANPPMYLEAAQSSTELGGLTQLQGGVQMRQGKRRFSALSAEYDQITNKARLDGDVRFREPGLLLLGDNAQIDSQTREAIFNNAQYVLHEEQLRGSAKQVIRLADERVRLEQGNYTYCPPQSSAWQLEADSIVLNKEEGFGTAEGAVLRIGGVPVIYAPYFTFPIDDTRRSGFLYPSFSYSEDNGFDVSVPYYFNIAPNMDDTLTPRLISERGLMLENEFRYLNSWSMNTLSAAYLADDDLTGEDRWLLGVKHKGTPATNWRSEIDYSSVSDQEYFDDLDTDLEINRQDHLDQRADLSYHASNWNFRARVHDYQTIDSGSKNPYKTLPQLTLNGHYDLMSNSEIRYLAEYSMFDRDLDGLTGADRVTGDRVLLLPEFSYQWQNSWSYLKPTVRVWASNYSLDNQLTGLDDNPSVTAPIFSLDSGLYFERALNNGGHQTLEPRLFALYVSEEEQDDIPTFDSDEHEFDYNYLFRFNRFSGKDRIGDAQQVSLGVTSAFYNANGAEQASISVGQAYYFDDRSVTLESSAADETDSQSDIAAEVNWNVNSRLKASFVTALDHSDFDANEANIRLRYSSDLNHRIDFGYRYEKDERKQSDLSFIWPVARNWTAMGRWLYDIEESSSLETNLGLEYESCCWKVSFAGRRWLDDTDTYDNGIFLNLTLKGLGSFGTGGKSTLNDIIGYREREEHNEN